MISRFMIQWKRIFVVCLIFGLLCGITNFHLWAEESEEDICRDALARCMMDVQYSVHSATGLYCLIGYAFCVKYVKKN